MANVGIQMQRLYYNSSGDLLRIDTITMSGYIIREKTYMVGARSSTIAANGRPTADFGDWVFHSSGGRKVATDVYITSGSRTVDTIESIGAHDATGDSVTFSLGPLSYTIDLSDLPNVSDTV